MLRLLFWFVFELGSRKWFSEKETSEYFISLRVGKRQLSSLLVSLALVLVVFFFFDV
jgi:hypothetical protein